MEAFIFIDTEPGLFWTVAEEAERIQDVVNAHAVTGVFDVIIHVEYKEMNELREMIGKLQSINGVVSTQTSVAIPMSARAT